jgi:hypothetical protein
MTEKKTTKLSKKYIEKTANDTITGTLRDLFIAKNLELGENPTTSSQDWGTDFYIEVFNQETKRELLFLIQCKGTGKSPVVKKDKTFSFQMSLRHANYFYYELSEPLMFMVCDVQKKYVYWYSVQLDRQMENKIVQQVKLEKESLQVSIPSENILNAENFERFLAELEESRKVQIHKHNSRIKLKANYTTLKTNLEGLNIIDAIDKLLDLFEGISVFSTYMISEMYPFNNGINTSLNRSYARVYAETLSTNNDDLFDFIDNLEVRENKFYLKDTNVDYASVSNFQDKASRIMSFFSVNWITHLDWTGASKKSTKRICIHHLFTSNGCNCERCSYKKLNLTKTVELLSVEDNSLKLEHRLRKAYTYYLMADLEKSYREYKALINEVSINKNPGIYIVAKYNLLQLKKLVEGSLFGSARQEILQELENETFVLDEMLIPDYYLDIFKLIKENKFVDAAIWEVDNKLTEIQKLWFSDQFGGSSKNSYSRNLIIEFLRAYNFVEYNLLIHYEYREFEILVNKSLEGMIALYSLLNPASSKYDHFGYTIIDMWLFHAESKQVKHSLIKYRVQSLNLEFENVVFDRLNLYIVNLINSATIITDNFRDSNYTHNDKIQRIIQNYLLIISVVNLDSVKKNLLLSKYLHLVETLDEWYFTCFDSLNDFLNYKNDVSTENLERTIGLMISHKHYHHDVFTSSINLYTKKFKGAIEIENAVKKVLQIDNFNAEDFCNGNNFSNLIFLIQHLTSETRETIKADIKSRLNENFDDNVFYIFCIYNVIDYNKELFDKYLDLTPDYTIKQTGHEFLSGKKEQKNYHLDKTINLMFKFDLEFTPEIRALSSRAIDKVYYDWLMDIDGFDYSKFNLYWILYYKTEAYFKAFRKSGKLKSKIASGLKEQYIEGVAKVLINKLGD